jgi:hypothetical protein
MDLSRIVSCPVRRTGLLLIATLLASAAAAEVLKIGEGSIRDPRALTTTANGDLVVVDARNPGPIVMRFASDGHELGETPLPTEVHRPEWAAIDAGGRCLVLGEGKAWVVTVDGHASLTRDGVASAALKTTAAGEALYLLDGKGASVGRSLCTGGAQQDIALSTIPAKGRLSSLHVRSDGHLYAYSGEERVVYHYDAKGTLVERFGSGGDLRCGIPAGYINEAFDVDDHGDIYWSLANYGALLHYSADGSTGFHFHGQESWDHQWTGPIHTLSGFALSGERGYAVDGGLHRITGLPRSWVSSGAKDCDEVSTRCFGLKFEVTTPHPYKLLTGPVADLTIAFQGGNRRLQQLVLHWQLRDLHQLTVSQGDLACSLPGNAAAAFALPLTLPRLGWYQLDIAMRSGSETLMDHVTFLGRTLEDAALPIPERESSGWNDMATHKAFGMGVHRFHFPKNDQELATLLTDLASARTLGIPFFLQITDKASCTPDNVRMILAMVPDLPALEIVNEPNLNTSPADYVKLLKPCYEAARAANPKVQVLGPAECGAGLGWFTAFFKEGGGNYVDAISIHTYERHNSMDAAHWQWKLAQLHQVMEHYGCAGKPIWQTEHGYLGDYHGMILRHRWQARSMLLEYLVLDREGTWPERNFYYYLNSGGFADFSSYLVDGRREPYPAALLMRTRSAMLGSRRFAAALPFPRPADWLLLGNRYEGADHDVVMIANTGCFRAVSVQVTLPEGAKAFDCFGNPLDLGSGRTAVLQIEEWPTYLTIPHLAALSAEVQGGLTDLTADARISVDDPQAAAKIPFLHNGILEYDFEDEPERDGFRATPGKLPLDVTVEFPQARRLSRSILYGSFADNDKCTPTAFTVQVRVDGQWKDVDDIKVPLDGTVLKLEGQIARLTWYDDPWIFVSDFAPVLADAIRFHVTATSFGQWPVATLGLSALPQQLHLRELQVFGP